jgi:hypothetical protein
MSSDVPFPTSRSAPMPARRQVTVPTPQALSPLPVVNSSSANAPPTPRRPAPQVANPTPRTSTGSNAPPPDYNSMRNSYAEPAPESEDEEDEEVRRAIQASLAEPQPAPRQASSASRQTWDDNASLHSAQSRKASGKKSIFSRS